MPSNYKVVPLLVAGLVVVALAGCSSSKSSTSTTTGTLGAAGGARGTLRARASCQRDHDQTGDKQRHDLVVAWHRTNPSSILRIERNRISPPESSGGSSFRSGLTLRTAAGACTGRTAQDGRDSSPLPAYGSGAKPTSAASGGRAAKSRALGTSRRRRLSCSLMQPAGGVDRRLRAARLACADGAGQPGVGGTFGSGGRPSPFPW